MLIQVQGMSGRQEAGNRFQRCLAVMLASTCTDFTSSFPLSSPSFVPLPISKTLSDGEEEGEGVKGTSPYHPPPSPPLQPPHISSTHCREAIQ